MVSKKIIMLMSMFVVLHVDASQNDSDDDDLLAFGPVTSAPKPSQRAVALPGQLAKSLQQPVQPFQIQKISLKNDQIPSVVARIQDELILKFTGFMSPEQVQELLIKEGYSSYDQATMQKIVYAITYNLQDIEGLADVMYQSLSQRSDFGFRPTDNVHAQERYLKNYLRMKNKSTYISDELTKALMQRFAYEKLKKDEFLQYANDFYARMIQHSAIDSLLNIKDTKARLNSIKNVVQSHFQYSLDPEIVKLRHRVPIIIIQDNLQAQKDVHELIDMVAKKIGLPAKRQSEDLGKELEERFKQLRPHHNKQ